jgi:hypothetical protein
MQPSLNNTENSTKIYDPYIKYSIFGENPTLYINILRAFISDTSQPLNPLTPNDL